MPPMMVGWVVLAWTLAAAFWLPGWLVARRLALPQPHLAGVLLSALSTYLLLFVGNLAGVPLTRGVVLTAITLVAIVAAVATRGRSATLATERVASTAPAGESLLRTTCLLIFAIAATILAIRAIRQPLTGWDTAFRWSWLAEQLVHLGHFNFYPPNSPADYRLYSYADGIPPLTQFGHFLSYVGFGKIVLVATAPLVIAQFLVIGATAYALGRDLAGDAAGLIAIALCGLSPLLLWSVVMGQETGWTAISIAAMVLYLRNLKPGDWRAALAGGAAAAVAALTREYGCAMVILAAGWCLWRRAFGRELAIVCGFGLIAFSWYLRNWVLTGNPVFSNNLAGIFPDNAVHSAYLEGYRNYLSPFKHAWAWRDSAAYLLRGALAPLLLGTVGILWCKRGRTFSVLVVGLTCLCWIYSLGVTAGGPIYAVRMLSPVVVVLAAAGGAWVARAPATWFAGGACLVLIGALPGLATVPHYVDGYRLNPILKAADAPRNWFTPRALALPRAIPERPAAILTDNAYARRWLAGTGIATVPVWSPEVSYVFDAGNDAATIRRQLLENGIRYVYKSNGGLNDAYLRTVPFFADDQSNWHLVYQDGQNQLYRLPE